jgi:hypothetical protein
MAITARGHPGQYKAEFTACNRAVAVSAMTANQQPGPWIEAWLSPPRFGVYLAAASGDRQLALDIYERNAVVSATFHHDLAHLEVALRNAYDAAIVANTPPVYRTGRPTHSGCSQSAGAPRATVPASMPTAPRASRSSEQYGRRVRGHSPARSSPS